MFRIVCDPSSGSIELYLTEIRSGSLMFVVSLAGVWQRNFKPVMCVYGTTGWDNPSYRIHTPLVQKLRCQSPTKHTTNISEPLRNSVHYSSVLPDDGSHRSETCWSDF